jgi:hypothetical protein
MTTEKQTMNFGQAIDFVINGGKAGHKEFRQSHLAMGTNMKGEPGIVHVFYCKKTEKLLRRIYRHDEYAAIGGYPLDGWYEVTE